jgi:hypothetical protein
LATAGAERTGAMSAVYAPKDEIFVATYNVEALFDRARTARRAPSSNVA